MYCTTRYIKLNSSQIFFHYSHSHLISFMAGWGNTPVLYRKVLGSVVNFVTYYCDSDFAWFSSLPSTNSGIVSSRHTMIASLHRCWIFKISLSAQVYVTSFQTWNFVGTPHFHADFLNCIGTEVLCSAWLNCWPKFAHLLWLLQQFYTISFCSRTCSSLLSVDQP